MIGINKTINEVLKQDQSLLSLVENKIYSLKAPEGTVNPFIVHWRSGLSSSTINKQYTEQNAVVEVLCVGSSYSESVDIAESVLNCLHQKKLDNNYWCYFLNGEEFITDKDNQFIQVLTFNIY